MNTETQSKSGPFLFCLDVGGSRTRGALFDSEGEELARATAAGGALSLGVERSRCAIIEVWNKLCEVAPEAGPSVANTELWAGIAGVSLTGKKEQLALELNEFSGTHFVSDGYGALMAATAGQPGAMISVGTGVIALRLDQEGCCLTLGGWGQPGGDIGGGAWLGREMLSHLFGQFDGVETALPLPKALVQGVLEVTGESLSEIMHWHHQAAPRQFASLVPLIVEQGKAGDPASLALLKSGAMEIAALGRALFRGVEGGTDPHAIHLAGGLGATFQPLCAELAPEFIWDSCEVDPVAGILLLATGQAPAQTLLLRPGFATRKNESRA